MSIGAKLLNAVMRVGGIKKKYALPEKQFMREVEKMNRHRGFYMSKDKKAYYEDVIIFGKYHCLKIQLDKKPSKRAILFFFGGGMLIDSDRGDVAAAVKLGRKSGCDVWFPYYPLCTDHCITETYEMGFECYRRMIEVYGGGNVSTCGFSSGGALAIGMALYNNTLAQKLPMPEHIVAVSPGEVPWNDKEKLRMKALNDRDVMVDYAFMKKVEKFMRHGQKNVPEYMLSGTKGDYSGINDITFFYSTDEVLYGAKDMFVEACKRYGVKYKVYERPGMVHCYPFLPYYREAKEDFNIIVDILS